MRHVRFSGSRDDQKRVTYPEGCLFNVVGILVEVHVPEVHHVNAHTHDNIAAYYTHLNIINDERRRAVGLASPLPAIHVSNISPKIPLHGVPSISGADP